ncbi:MAG: methyltransferase [Candidatus Diapherotrites archaeon]|uniref:Methyltransferase n=1 Tax=Candidatus Iainarchaeum sp. TaxID=3101447 RepID=A0A8T4L6L3_9ARCH|nr:methyltransferase [Candidatus Diapherotrites archaeon]
MNNKIFEQLKITSLEGIYPIGEDSELLSSALFIPKNASCLDLGCGTGIQGITMAKQGAKKITFGDINPNALENARINVLQNHVKTRVSFVQTDVFSNVSESFDVIAFNPPYVPSDDIQWIETDGGKKGRKILDRFLETVSDHLSPAGEVFFLQTSLNGTKKTEEILRKKGFRFEIICRQKLFFEELLVFHAQKNPKPADIRKQKK